jgi:hypothetical protein
MVLAIVSRKHEYRPNRSGWWGKAATRARLIFNRSGSRGTSQSWVGISPKKSSQQCDPVVLGWDAAGMATPDWVLVDCSN